ncbi:DUF2798 domain-containing protein [Fictibacillus sp. Mic-4]|uniref:DUF2798 domain-containing protein n=1 Tax=Fictibacillus sp. Mic-4 TaxID=3132826 RepID=UPI003CECF16B
MPTTKKESVYFTIIMCFGMVAVMMFYNMYLSGVIGVMSFTDVIVQFFTTFALALLVDLLIVAPLAKKIVFKLPYDKSKKIYVLLSISTCMVIGMVFCMSFYGLMTQYVNNSLTNESLITSYFTIVMKNFIVAYPLQLIIMGPLVRYVFVNFIKRNKVAKTV